MLRCPHTPLTNNFESFLGGAEGHWQGLHLKPRLTWQHSPSQLCTCMTQDPNQAMEALRIHTETHAPPQTRLTFRKLAFHAQPYLMPRDNVANRAATKVQSHPCTRLGTDLDRPCMCICADAEACCHWHL